MPVINGKANWAFLSRLDSYGNYTITVDVPEDFINVLKDGKVKAKVDDIDHEKEGEVHDADKKFKFNFRRKGERGAPEVYDSQMNPFPAKTLIGNGSTVNVQYSTYEYPDGGSMRTAIGLEMIQIMDLIPYVRVSKPEFGKSEGGYVAPKDGVI